MHKAQRSRSRSGMGPPPTSASSMSWGSTCIRLGCCSMIVSITSPSSSLSSPTPAQPSMAFRQNGEWEWLD